MTPALPLAGRGIVITRPERQAAALAELVRSRGGTPVLFPVIEIRDMENSAGLDGIIDRLESFDLAIFVSPNAVEKAREVIARRRPLPLELTVATVGRGSARELRKLGFKAVLAPAEGADSESLLALPELHQVAGRTIVIFRGVGGRELMGETLTARGARVTYAECYERVRPSADASGLATRWARGEIDASVVTSSEGLRNFAGMLGPSLRERLRATPMFVPHPRIAATARELGLGEAVVTGSGDEAIVAALVQHFTRAR